MAHPYFVVSDLHLGDGGPRDNFAWMSGGWRAQEFSNFLDHVEDEDGDLIIAGDLLELWQANMSKVVVHRLPLLDRLADMGAVYLIGNHDIDLMYFTSEHGVVLDHPLFANLKMSHTIQVKNKSILITHGHEQDAYCRDEKPGVGRLSAIYTGLKEDRNGGPLAKKYDDTTIEAQTLNRVSRVGCQIRRLFGRPTLRQAIHQEVLKHFESLDVDAFIFGHTHEAGQFHDSVGGLPIYNTGSWADQVNSFARIDGGSGEVALYDWVRDRYRPNTHKIKVK